MKTLFRNGRIFTGEEGKMYADWMLSEDGIIRMMGSEAETAPDADRVVDLQEKRVIPGLIDAHMHGVLLAEYSKQISCLPPRIGSIEELVAEIRDAAGSCAGDAWIKGWGYDEGKLAEGRAPDRHDLDRGSKDHPVYIARTCVHIASVNSRALALAGIDRNTPDPPGGHIVRDAQGEPTGILQENARNLVLDLMPRQTIGEQAADVADLGRLLLSQGIIAFTDMGTFGAGDPMACYEAAAKAGLSQDVAVYYMAESLREIEECPLGAELQAPGRQVRVAGLKLISDGSISGQTACVEVPYRGGENCGIYVLADELLDRAVGFCRENRCQLAVHAMGGRAIEKVLDRVTEEENWMEGEAPFLRMEHITEPKEASIIRAADRGVMFAVQPVFQYCEIESYLANLGPERTKRAYPLRHMMEKGVGLALSTDAPATSWAVPSDPWTNIKAAVTRTAYDGTDCGRAQAVDAETAIRLYTGGAARICGFQRLGKLAPGYRACFDVLDRDVLRIPADEIDQVRVDEVYIDGRPVYTR